MSDIEDDFGLFEEFDSEFEDDAIEDLDEDADDDTKSTGSEFNEFLETVDDDAISVLSKITQPDHSSSQLSSQPYLTRYEHAAAVGWRAAMIEGGAIPLINTDDYTDPLDIAQKEYEQGLLPINFIRPIPDRGLGNFKQELVKINELYKLPYGS